MPGATCSARRAACDHRIARRLQHLASVWKPVMPVQLFQQVMGQLLHVVLEGVMRSIQSLEVSPLLRDWASPMPHLH